jgi:transglutaminase-like putative cysteine protease
MKLKLTIIALILFNVLNAQNYKFGKVSVEELSEEKNPDYPEANATVLYKSRKITYEFNQNYGFVQTNEYHERIKIYNQNGFEWATKKIKLYKRTVADSEKLIELKGYTFNLIDNKIEREKLRNEGVFETKNNEYWTTTTYTMPEIKVGSVIEITYIIETPYNAIEDIILQYDIPIKKVEVDVLIPEYFRYKRILNPKASIYPTINNYSKYRKETIKSKERTPSGGRMRTDVTTSELDFKDIGFKVDLVNVPALIDEPFVDNRDNYRSKIILEYEAYKDQNGQVTNYASSWDKVTSEIYDDANFGSQLNKTGYFNKEIDAITQGISDPKAKIEAIYNFVKQKVKWNNFVGFRADKGVKEAFKDGVGNIGDINLMLTAMLRYSGLNANPVLISTRSNGIPIVPTISGFNYVVAAVELPEELILLDASSQYATINVLPEIVLNWRGRIIREYGSSAWVNLTTYNNRSYNNMIGISINEDLSISGKVRSQYVNYAALSYREKYSSLGDESYIKNLENGKGDIEISNLKKVNENSLNKPVMISYDFKLNSGVEKIGDKLYVSPLLFLANDENLLKQDSRNYPMDFICTLNDKTNVSIMIPEGYVVESVPENTKIEFNGKAGEFGYILNYTDNAIQLIVNFELNQSTVLAKDYEVFKEFYQMMVDKNLEKIVLKRI